MTEAIDTASINRKIAVFMDIPKCKRCADCGAYQYSSMAIYHPHEMNYHKDWNWLLPVIHAIVKLIDNNPAIDWELFHEDETASRILHLYIWAEIDTALGAVIAFIDWLNEQNR